MGHITQINLLLQVILKFLSKILTIICPYDIIILGNLNSEMSEDAMGDFCGMYNFKNLVKKPTCYKNLDNPSYIDLILTNRQNLFQDTTVIETGLSDFHKLTATVSKVYFKKEPPKNISYRDYKNFTKFRFRNELDQLLLRSDLENISNDEFVNIL